MPHDLPALARRFELAEAEGMAECLDAWVARTGDPEYAAARFGRAVVIVGPRSCKLARGQGFGMDGPISDADLDHAELLFSKRAESLFNVAPYADPGFLPLLARRGYSLRRFTNLLWRDLRGDRHDHAPLPEDWSSRLLDKSDLAAVEAVARLIGRGFLDGQEPPEADLLLGRQVMLQPATRTVVIAIDGVDAGAGTLSTTGGVASLFGASVLPEFRRRGVQSALIRERLRIGVGLACDVATIQCTPGIGTERNAIRLGFAMAYTKVTMGRELPGPGSAVVGA